MHKRNTEPMITITKHGVEKKGAKLPKEIELGGWRWVVDDSMLEDAPDWYLSDWGDPTQDPIEAMRRQYAGMDEGDRINAFKSGGLSDDVIQPVALEAVGDVFGADPDDVESIVENYLDSFNQDHIVLNQEAADSAGAKILNRVTAARKEIAEMLTQLVRDNVAAHVGNIDFSALIEDDDDDDDDESSASALEPASPEQLREDDERFHRDSGFVVESTRGAEGKGLWHNIRKKREEGRPPAKPGDTGYPDKKQWDELTRDAARMRVYDAMQRMSEIDLERVDTGDNVRFMSTFQKPGWPRVDAGEVGRVRAVHAGRAALDVEVMGAKGGAEGLEVRNYVVEVPSEVVALLVHDEDARAA